MQDKIRQLVEEELARANEKFPPFHSAHEGWAVLREEVEETELEFNGTVKYLATEILWENVKEDDQAGQAEYLKHIYNATLRMINEAIQVAAMARKFEQFLEGSKEK